MSLILLLSLLYCSTFSQDDDWDCGVSKGVNRYGYLGGSQTFTIDGQGSGCVNSYAFSMSGSSTVYPLAKIWAVEFNQCQRLGCSTITLSGGGSSTGASDVCNDISDIGDMSRDFKHTETFQYDTEDDSYTHVCLDDDQRPTDNLVSQIPVALDGITIFVQSDTNISSCLEAKGGLTYGELRWIFSSYTDAQLEAQLSYVPPNSDGSFPRKWSEIDANCVDETITIYGSDENGGTYVFLSDELFYGTGETFDVSRNYNEQDDDETLTGLIQNDPYGIAYMGFSHYQRHEDTLYGIQISDDLTSGGTDGSIDYISPIIDTIADGSYPISRTIYMNVDDKSFSENDAIYDFLAFGFSETGQQLLINQTGYVELPSDQYSSSFSIIETRGALNEEYYQNTDLSGSTVYEYSTEVESCNSYKNLNFTGSTTVFPVIDIWAYHYIQQLKYYEDCMTIRIDATTSSTRGGSNVCNRVSDVAMMSRTFKETEASVLSDGYTYQCLDVPLCVRLNQLNVGIDGVVVFVKSGTSLATCLASRGGLSYNDVKAIFSAQSDTKKWNSVLESSCPNEEVQLYLGSLDGGTVTFFCDEIFGGDCTQDTFYDNAIYSITSLVLENVQNDDYAIGVASYAHYTRYAESLYAIPLDEDTDGDYVVPSANTISNSRYPFTRTLYVNVRKDLEADEDLQNFLYFGFNTEFGQLILEDVLGYTSLDSVSLQEQINRIPGNRLYFAAGETCDSTSQTPTNNTNNNNNNNNNGTTTIIKKDKNYDNEIDGLLTAIILVFVILSIAFCCFFYWAKSKILGSRVGFQTAGNTKTGRDGVQMTRVEQDESDE